MDAASYRIPLDIAHKILATFGITRPTRAYDRWVKPDGFDLKDFDEVLYESPFVFIIDWKAWLQEELETIADALRQLDVHLQVELDEDGNSGIVACGDRRETLAYVPIDDSEFDDVVAALQAVVPQRIEFRASPDNHTGDTAVYGVLPRDEWAELEELANEVVKHFFVRLTPSDPK